MDQITENEAMGRDLPVLQGKRLTLRVAAPEDADALHAELCDWDVVRMLARVPWPVPEGNLRHFLQRARDRALRGEAFEMAILPGGQYGDYLPCGVVGFERLGGDVQLGYWIGRAHWGRGLMTEAVELALDHVFARTPDVRVVSGVYADNPASLRIQEKLGFCVIGAHMHWCEARRQDVRHIDTALTRAQFTRRPE